MKNLFLFTVLSLFLISCEKELPPYIDVPEEEIDSTLWSDDYTNGGTFTGKRATVSFNEAIISGGDNCSFTIYFSQDEDRYIGCEFGISNSENVSEGISLLDGFSYTHTDNW